MKLFYIIAIGFLFACSSDDPQVIEEPLKVPDHPLKGLPDRGPIRFDDPQIGQRSHYVFFKATENNNTHDINFDYIPDTLVLAITDKEGDKWIVKEFLTNGSNSKTSADGAWVTFAHSVLVRHLAVNSDSAYFLKPAGADPFSFVFVGGSRRIPLKPVGDPAPLNVGCLPEIDYASTLWMEYTVDYSQFGQTFQHLNNYFDYRPMATDGSGFMYAYGPSFGLVRWTFVNYWELDYALGWDLIPNP